MADDPGNPNLQIGIETSYDPTGTKNAEADIKRLSTEAKGASSGAVKNAEEEASAHKGLHESLEKIRISRHSAGALISGLRHEIPQLGHLVHLFIHPMSIGIAAAAATVGHLIEKLNELNAAIQHTAGYKSMLELIAAQSKALEEAERAGLKYTLQVEASARANVGETKVLEEQIDVLRKLNVAKAEQADAEKALAIAQVDLEEKSGRISGPEAIRQRLDIETRFAEQRQKMQEQEIQSQMLYRRQILEGLEVSIRQLEPKIEHYNRLIAGIGTPEALEGQVSNRQENIQKQREAIKERKKRIDELSDSVDTLQGLPLLLKGGVSEAMLRTKQGELGLQSDIQKRDEEQLKADEEQLAIITERNQIAIQRRIVAESELEGLKKDLQNAVQQKRARESSFQDSELLDRTRLETIRKVGGLGRQTSGVKALSEGAPTTEEIEKIASLLNQYRSEGNVSGKNLVNVVFDHLTELATANKDVLAQVVQALQNQKEINDAEMTELRRRIRELQGYSTVNRP